MKACKKCGMEIMWRTLGGERIPLGCECNDRGSGRLSTSEAEGFTRMVVCPKCACSVYFVRHNGGSVWLDELGDPWPKHPCFDDQGSTEGLSEFFRARMASISGVITDASLVTDLDQRLVYIVADSMLWELYPSPGFWNVEPEPRNGTRLVLDTIKKVIRIGKGLEFRYWIVRPMRCGRCQRMYLSERAHWDKCPPDRFR